MNDFLWLERISAADIAATKLTRKVVQTGAFTLLLDPIDDFGGVNWATPRSANPTALELEALIQAFRDHGRSPRLEFMAGCWPGLAGVLERAGFASEGGAQDILLLTSDDFRPYAAPSVRVQMLENTDSDALFCSYLETQGRGFGYSSDPPSLEHLWGWKAQVREGRRAALAFLEARAVGVGTLLGSELAELQGVTTLPDARRRGVAATLSSHLIKNALEQGTQAVWLSVENPAARACYLKLGFRALGSRLNYRLA